MIYINDKVSHMAIECMIFIGVTMTLGINAGIAATVAPAASREYTQASYSMKWSKENILDFLATVALPIVITIIASTR